MKKALSIFTVAAMLIALFSVMLPVSASADAQLVGSADELKAVITKINNGDLPEDTNITLTADIDLTGVEGWKPIKSYSGTFDGAGFTVKNLSHSVTIVNNAADKLDGGTNTAEYVIVRENDGMGSGCYGQVGIALLVVKSNGATLKNFTLKDSNLSVTMNFNKNWQPFYGGVVASMDGGTVSGVKLENVDVTVDSQSAVNQGFLGFAGLMAGTSKGTVMIGGCSIDDACTLDASKNKKFDVAAYVGRHSSGETITFANCTTGAEIKAAPDVSSKDDLMYKNDDAMLGGAAAAFTAFINENAKVVLHKCENTGSLTGAKSAGNAGIDPEGNAISPIEGITSGDQEKNGVQFREIDGRTDARVVIEGRTVLLEEYENVELRLTFQKKTGETGKLTRNLDAAYTYVTAAGETLEAAEGFALTGVVVTGVNRDELASISVSVILDGQLEVPIGTATISE